MLCLILRTQISLPTTVSDKKSGNLVQHQLLVHSKALGSVGLTWHCVSLLTVKRQRPKLFYNEYDNKMFVKVKLTLNM